MRGRVLESLGVALIVAAMIAVAVLVRTNTSQSGLTERSWLPAAAATVRH
jgi:hypothetical protein